MRAYASFLVRSFQSQPLAAAAAVAAMIAASLAYSDISKIKWAFPEPGWLNSRSIQILIVAIAILSFSIAYVFSRQAMKEKHESEDLRRLRLQPYSTFREIALATSKSGSTYSKQEILDRLMRAAIAGEFSERTGHSRMRITPPHAESTLILERPIIRISDLEGFRNPKSYRSSPGSIIYKAMLLRARSSQEKIDPIELLTLERSEFLRWHRRFRNGRYED